MNSSLLYWVVFCSLTFCFIILNVKYNLFEDISIAASKPYSYSRIQLCWWTIIIVTSFITILICKHNLPVLDESLIILLGISGGTTGVVSMIDTNNAIPNTTIVRIFFFNRSA